MNLSLVFLLSIYVLAGYSSLVLMWAEGNSFPAIFTLPLSVLTFYFVDIKQLFRLNTFWANVAGLTGLLAMLTEIFGDNPEGRLLGPVHLIVYLLWIVLCQPKQTRQFWFICVLALLQVVAAAVLTQEQWFGGTLVLYVFLGTWVLSLFSLYRAEHEFRQAAGDQVDPGKSRKATSTPAPIAEPVTGGGSSFVRGSIQQEASRGWIGGRFVSGVGVVSLMSVIVGMLTFVLIPRVWIGNRVTFADTPTPAIGRTLTGFSENVKLGDLGQVLESNERVMEVRVFDDETGDELDPGVVCASWGFEEPVFRGSVLGRYERGQWTADLEFQVSEPVPKIPIRGQIRQEIRLEPIGSNVLFCLGDWLAVSEPQHRIQFAAWWTTDVLFVRREDAGRKSLEYRVYSRREMQSVAGHPALSVSRGMVRNYREMDYFDRHLRLDRRELAPLIELAHQAAGYSPNGETNPTPSERAVRLENFLKNSTEFDYTLNLRIQNPTVDPVVDFLIYRKQGHCEYFASALALMLRAVDVPSRVVNGFKGATVNRLNGRLVVQQRHAHSWVEAFVDDKWMILDPTPAARQDSVDEVGSRIGGWTQFAATVGEFWNHYVLNLSLSQQRREFYEPVRAGLQAVLASISNVRKTLYRAVDTLRRILSDPTRWFSVQGGLLAFGFLLGVVAVFKLSTWLYGQLRHFSYGLANRSRGARCIIDFEDRFRRWATARGLAPLPYQTAREYSQLATERFESELQARGVGHLPEAIAKAYNLVRFGGRQLQDDEYRRLRMDLDRLEATSGSASR